MPQFFGKPQSYAPFLESEIAFNTKKPLLIVMPQGFGAGRAAERDRERARRASTRRRLRGRRRRSAARP